MLGTSSTPLLGMSWASPNPAPSVRSTSNATAAVADTGASVAVVQNHTFCNDQGEKSALDADVDPVVVGVEEADEPPSPSPSPSGKPLDGSYFEFCLV